MCGMSAAWGFGSQENSGPSRVVAGMVEDGTEFGVSGRFVRFCHGSVMAGGV